MEHINADTPPLRPLSLPLPSLPSLQLFPPPLLPHLTPTQPTLSFPTSTHPTIQKYGKHQPLTGHPIIMRVLAFTLLLVGLAGMAAAMDEIIVDDTMAKFSGKWGRVRDDFFSFWVGGGESFSSTLSPSSPLLRMHVGLPPQQQVHQ